MANVLKRISGTLDRGLRILLVAAAIVVFVVAVLMMATMEASARSQGGRTYAAIAAIVILAGIDGLYTRLEDRRRPLWMEGRGEDAYRRYVFVSAGLLLVAAAALIGSGAVASLR